MNTTYTILSPLEIATRTNAILRNIAAMKSESAEPTFTALETICTAEAQSTQIEDKTLADFQDPVHEEENPAALFKNGWLRKGGAAILVSTSGTGKSVFTIQAAICWTMGFECFGIAPVRPLNIAIIQAEDDDDEISDFRNQITQGLVEKCGFNGDEIRAAWKRIRFADFTGKVGDSFTFALASYLSEHPEIDLVIMNPLQSFLGADLNRNADLSHFFRERLDPVIKPSKVGLLIVHHTNKPPQAKDRAGWGTDAFAAYVGAGGAELVNWARAILALMPCENMPKVFRLVAGKRGDRLGWKDANGEATRQRLIAHSEGFIFWRDATPEECAKAGAGQNKMARNTGDPRKDAGELASALQRMPILAAEARKKAQNLCGKRRGDAAFDYLKTHLTEFELCAVDCRFKGAVFYGKKGPSEEAAERYNRENEIKVKLRP